MGKKKKKKNSPKATGFRSSLAGKLAGVQPQSKKRTRGISTGYEESFGEQGEPVGLENQSDCDVVWQEWQDLHPLDAVSSFHKSSSKSNSKRTLIKSKQAPIRTISEAHSANCYDQLLKKVKQLEQEHKNTQEEAKKKIVCLELELKKVKKRILSWQRDCEKEREAKRLEEVRSLKFLQERDEARKELLIPQDQTIESLSSLMDVRGIPKANQIGALMCLVEEQGDSLLSLLVQIEGGRELLEKHLVLCCGHTVCLEELSYSSTRHPLQVKDSALCEHCLASDTRRAFLKMVRICRKHRRYKIVLVGGSPDAHTEIMRLSPQGFIHRIVTGEERRGQQQANDDMRYADLVVIWGPTFLPHKISELYTKRREAYPNKIVLILRRGLASLALEVTDFLESSLIIET